MSKIKITEAEFREKVSKAAITKIAERNFFIASQLQRSDISHSSVIFERFVLEETKTDQGLCVSARFERDMNEVDYD